MQVVPLKTRLFFGNRYDLADSTEGRCQTLYLCFYSLKAQNTNCSITNHHR